MQFQISKNLFEMLPEAKVGALVLHGVVNKSQETKKVLDLITTRLKGQANRLNHKHFRNWHSALTKLNTAPDKHPASHYALTQRVVKSGDLPDINPIVNIVNAMVAKHQIPIGAHDITQHKVIEISQTDTLSKFTPINETQPQSALEGEWSYINPQTNQILTRHLVWRQSDHSKVSAESTQIFIPIDDLPNMRSRQELETIALEIVELAQTYLKISSAQFTILDKYKSSVNFDQDIDTQIQLNGSSLLKPDTYSINTNEVKIDEVLDKGVKDIFPSRDKLKELLLSGKRIRLYCGIDPTADFIHMGHMIWMKKLKQFQDLGHEVIFLIGGFTAMIGDPDKMQEREPLTREQVAANFENYKADASRILDFDSKTNPVTVKNNYDWLSQLTLEDWLTIMSNITIQHLYSHETFRKRIENQLPVRLHEMMYPLMQGYDGVHMEVDLEVGGSDQTFNMLTGRVLSEAMLGKEKFVMTMKLLTDNNGKKMGKTTNNAISFKDKPNDVYGKIMSFSDEILPLAYELLSAKPMSEIKNIAHEIKINPMQLKKNLAYEITTLMFDTQAADAAADFFATTIQNKETPTDIKTYNLSEFAEDNTGIKLAELLTSIQLTNSNGEAKRLMEQGGVKLNGEKITDLGKTITPDDLPVTIQAGKLKWAQIV